MAQLCPACSTQNLNDSLSCVRCGTPLVSAPSGNLFTYGYQQRPIVPDPSGSPPAYQQQPIAPNPPAFAPAYQQQTMEEKIQRLYPDALQPMQMGTVGGQGQDLLKYRRAFAGYGVPIMHHSWLLEGQQDQASSLHTAILQILGQRNSLGFKLTVMKMKESGYQTEERRYIIAQRGVSTVFIYVAPAGRDLYISRATSVLTRIDIFRVIVLFLLVALALFGPSTVTAILTSSASASNLGAYALASLIGSLFILLSGAIWIYLIRLAYLSFKYWLAEKDFWVYLRTQDLNDFQVDDVALLEHSTDETVLTAVKQRGLDASKIVPPKDYKPERHIRVV